METLYPRQQKLLDEMWEKEAYAIFWKPRRGKTAPVLINAQWLWEHNKIDACLILVRNPLHLNFSQNEIPMWLPNALVHEWLSSERQYPLLWDKQINQLLFFCVNIEALQISELQEYLFEFVKKYKTLLIVDESHDLKSTKFKRTEKKRKPRARIVRELAKKCPYRRILTGTPDPNGPFDYWSQFYILDPQILGPSSTKFKSRYGVFEQGEFYGQRVPILKGYQNLEELKEKIAPYTSWGDIDKDAPIPKSAKQFFEMEPKQFKIYKQLEKEFYTIINNKEFLVDHVLTRLLRLHQLARGFFDGQSIAPFCAMESLKQIINPKEKTIIWAHFKPELKVLDSLKQPHITISSEIKTQDRLPLIKKFNESRFINLLISSPSLAGVGTDISGATHMIFYSNSYHLDDREQALYRFQGDKQKAENLLVTDLVASHSVDLKCLASLEKKQNVAESFRRNK